ncbi:MAG: MFS transporter [bacterium]|nr:MFS transporter [bacterium]MDE0601694.1 MFS transporter [bacterium]
MSPTSRREQLALLMTVCCLGMTHLSLVSPVLPELANALGVSISVVGWVQGSAAFPGIFLAIFVGYLADRFGGRRVILTCVTIFTIFGSACFLATSFPMLLGLRVLQGVGTSGIVGVAVTLIGELFEDDQKRLRVLGTNLALMYLTQLVVPVLSGIVAGGGAFRPFLLYLVGVPIAIWAYRLGVGQPRGTASSPIRHIRAAHQDLRRRRTGVDFLGLIMVTAIGVMVFQGATLTAVPLMLDEVFGTASTGRGLVVSAFLLGAMVSVLGVVRVISGRISGRVLSTGIWLMSVGLFTVLMAGFPLMVSAGLALAGAGFGLVITLAQRDAIASCSPAYRGVVMLTWVAGVRVAQVIAPPFASFVTGVVGPRSMFLMAAVLTAVAALAWRPLRSRLRGAFYT